MSFVFLAKGSLGLPRIFYGSANRETVIKLIKMTLHHENRTRNKTEMLAVSLF